jgi:CDP-glucose 4,6-dehydratase
MVTAAYRRSFFQADKLHSIAGVASARAGNVFGGGDWASDRLIPDAVRSALQRTELRVRNPDAVRPWQHVLEPLRGYLMLAERLCNDPKRFSGSWNFGPEKADVISVRQILDRLQKLSGNGFTWSSDPGVHPPEARYLRLDSTKSRNELGWQPQWHLDSALRATVDWHKSHEAGNDMRLVTERQIRSYQSHLPGPETLR